MPGEVPSTSSEKSEEEQPLLRSQARRHVSFGSLGTVNDDSVYVRVDEDGKHLAKSSSPSSFAKKVMKGVVGVIAVLVLVVTQSMQNLSFPLWINRLPKDSCVSPFVNFLLCCMVFVFFFFLTSIGVNVARRNHPFAFLWKYSGKQHLSIFATGLFDALNGALVLPSSPSDRTPPLVTALIGSTTLLPLIIVKHFYLLGWGKGKLKHYNTPSFAMVIILYLSAAYTIVYPIAKQDAHVGDNVYWWVIFFVGACFGQFYNVQQEKFFKVHHTQHRHVGDFCEYLFWQTLYMTCWGFALIWMDIIPNFGSSVNGQTLQCSLYDTMRFSFHPPALLYFGLFSIGYYLAYIVACFVNTSDALVGTVASVLVTSVVIIVSYPIKELTPDKKVVSIGLVPLTIILSSASMYMYMKWSKQTRIYEIVE
eukprot:m.22542 g.22542  ORF g.22542 m.22542 type:complete len:421 (-) comp8861_c0_seq1:90-1352(-)